MSDPVDAQVIVDGEALVPGLTRGVGERRHTATPQVSGQIGIWNADSHPDPVLYGRRLLDIAVRRYKPVAVFGMFSGGHDSVCAVDMASRHPAFTAAVHINTGIGVEATREYVRATAKERGWPLLEYTAEDQGQFYDDLVLAHGFPGPFHHTKMYNRLKERALNALVRDHKQKRSDRVLLITGVRKYESTRRMGTVQAINRDGAKVWVAPLTWWTNDTKTAYMTEHGLPRNEVVDALHMSGECLCGAFAKPRELEWLEFCGFQDEVNRIRNLEHRARAAGVPCKWGAKPPPQYERDTHGAPGFLCVGCSAYTEADDE